VNGFQRLRRALTLLLAVAIAACIKYEPVPPPGPPAQIGFLVQPPGAAAGTAFIPAVRVAVEDANGVVVNTGGPWSIALTVGNNPGGGTLAGEATSITSQRVPIFASETSDAFTITAP
jgi:hypothetical protein